MNDYKMIIVDDEQVIRDMLCENINWNEIGFEIVAVLEDGKDAIEYIENNPVDVILTDIRMTFVSGIGIAEYVNNNQMDIIMIFLSGYEDFEYARTAIRYGVKSYLIKPILVTEMIQTFQNIKNDLDLKRKKEENYVQIERQYNEILPLIKRQFFVDLTMGAIINKEEISRQNNTLDLHINVDKSQCCLIYLEISNLAEYLKEKWKYGKDGLYLAIQNIVQGSKDGMIYYLISGLGRDMQIFAYVEDGSFSELKNNINSYIVYVRQELTKILELDLKISLSLTYENLLSFVQCYSQEICVIPENSDLTIQSTNTSYEDYFLHNDGKIVEGKLHINDVDFVATISERKLKSIIGYLNIGNLEMSKNIFDNIINDNQQKGISIVDINLMVSNLFIRLYEEFNKLGIQFGGESERLNKFSGLNMLDDCEKIKAESTIILSELVQFIKEHKFQSEELLMEKAKDYIKKHCCDDITLDDLADYVYFSPAYFSRIFKEKTGENFIDYLIKMRMQKAIELLNNKNHKVYEISEILGYKSLRHFYKLFKQYTGLTPTEYRNNLFRSEQIRGE